MNKFLDYSGDELINELYEQLRNFRYFIPRDKEEFIKELYRNSNAYRAMAKDMTDILDAMRSKRMTENYRRINELAISDERLLNRTIPIILSGFNGNEPIKAKVDTGATMSSIDAQDVDVQKEHGLVTFTFGSHRVTMPVLDNQAVTSANNGITYRPVVEFDVLIPSASEDKKERVLKKIKFNLSDRSDMEDKVLLGMNFIKAGDFVVISSHGDKQQTTESFSPEKEAACRALYEQLLRSNVTFEDLIRFIRTDAYKVYESQKF